MPGASIRRTRTRTLARKRGAVMVESLILIPLLIILNVSLMYMHSVYDTRLSTMRSSRNEAWQYSLGACDSPTGQWVSTDGTDPSLLPLSADFATGMKVARSRTLIEPLIPKMDVGAATTTKTSMSGGSIEAFRARTMTTHTRVLCNEKQDHVSTMDKRATIHAIYGEFL